MKKNLQGGFRTAECEGRTEGREDLDSESASSDNDEIEEKEGSDFAGKRSEMQTEQDRYELVRPEEIRLTPCD